MDHSNNEARLSRRVKVLSSKLVHTLTSAQFPEMLLTFLNQLENNEFIYDHSFPNSRSRASTRSVTPTSVLIQLPARRPRRRSPRRDGTRPSRPCSNVKTTLASASPTILQSWPPSLRHKLAQSRCENPCDPKATYVVFRITLRLTSTWKFIFIAGRIKTARSKSLKQQKESFIAVKSLFFFQ